MLDNYDTLEGPVIEVISEDVHSVEYVRGTTAHGRSDPLPASCYYAVQDGDDEMVLKLNPQVADALLSVLNHYTQTTGYVPTCETKAQRPI